MALINLDLHSITLLQLQFWAVFVSFWAENRPSYLSTLLQICPAEER